MDCDDLDVKKEYVEEDDPVMTKTNNETGNYCLTKRIWFLTSYLLY